MFSKQTYTQRRKKLMQSVNDGLILIFGNNEVGMNYIGNPYPFRQDSNFLYFAGLQQPGLALMMDTTTGETILFGNELTIDDFIWIGPHPTLQSSAEKVGIEKVLSLKKLEEHIKNAKQQQRSVHFTPPYRFEHKLKIQQWLDIPAEIQKEKASMPLIQGIVNLRSYKSAAEIVEMEKAVNTTRLMHHAVIQHAAPGKKEAELAGLLRAIAMSTEGDMAYGIILSKDGQTLHNHSHSNILKEGDLVLGDFGAETKSRYAGDITRTFPISKTFTTQQREIYEIVLKAEEDCIEALRPGVPYRDIHLKAAGIIMDGLKDLGLMKGNTAAAVNEGAHALFFPHGLGHMIGLDVHDMEDLGEDNVGYSDTVKRSELFGTAYLRLGRKLEKDFVITVEPGIYFIPELIDQWKANNKFGEYINYDKLDAYRNFGGVRIEDDVLITENGSRVLGERIAKSVAEIEGMR